MWGNEALEPVTLVDGDLLLRAPQLEDVPAITAACQDPQTQRWTTIPVPYRREHAVSFVQDYAAGGWSAGHRAVFAITNARPVPASREPATDAAASPASSSSEPSEPSGYQGAIDLTLDGSGAAEVGFVVAPWARGRGVATVALRVVCRWGFEELGLARIEWQAHVGNWPSRRVAEKAGFTIEGTCRARLVARGQRRDGWIGGLLSTDPR